MSTIYIHWPFCNSKCSYCNFYSTIEQCNNYKEWLSLYSKVLRKMAQYHRVDNKSEIVTSIFFGGGTPSLMPSWLITNILDVCSTLFNIDINAEITLEANPCTLSIQKIKNLKNSGINRLSIGVQSLCDMELQLLGRQHNAQTAIAVLNDAAEIFDNISADFIYNLPGQTNDKWRTSLEQIITLPVKHLSLYELIVEPGTRIHHLIQSGEIPQQDSDDINFMHTTAYCLEQAGFKMYEISNFAKYNYQCKHNLSYWNYEEYYAVGPSSHARVLYNGNKYAIEQVANNNQWLKWAMSDCKLSLVKLDNNDILSEILIMGLRTIYGIALNKIYQYVDYEAIYNKILSLIKSNLAYIKNDRLILTKMGMIKINQVIAFLT